MNTARFKPGFILSITEIAVLVIGAAGSTLAVRVEWWMGLVVAFAVGHFFLFCNAFRVARQLELCWAGLFIALAGSTIAIDMPGIFRTI